MNIVIRKIVKQSSKKITIIYNNPVCPQTILNHKFILTKVYRDQWAII